MVHLSTDVKESCMEKIQHFEPSLSVVPISRSAGCSPGIDILANSVLAFLLSAIGFELSEKNELL